MSEYEDQLIREATGQNRDFEEPEPEETNDSNETGSTTKPKGKNMTPSDIRDHISQQCGFNKAKQGESPKLLTWPTIEEQEEYWRVRDKDLDRIESATAWFDNKAKTEIHF